MTKSTNSIAIDFEVNPHLDGIQITPSRVENYFFGMSVRLSSFNLLKTSLCPLKLAILALFKLLFLIDIYY
ncbi:hypothetical protein VB10N_44080 [Vibrio sp. 10N]|nr:hypothetical protein VB10N_44080 [Vibrio sp. 10N]